VALSNHLQSAAVYGFYTASATQMKAADRSTGMEAEADGRLYMSAAGADIRDTESEQCLLGYTYDATEIAADISLSQG